MKKHLPSIVIAFFLLLVFSVAGWYLYKHPEVAEMDDAKQGQGR